MKRLDFIVVFCAAVFFGFITISSHAAPNDPSGGDCDGLDPSRGLFSLCIQAHSAKNRVEHLQSVGASENAIGKAQAEVDDAEAMYSELGGGAIPGLYDIGDTGPAGGIVFYLDGTGGGLEAAPEDLGIAKWGCNADLGAYGTAIGTGEQNTAIIFANCVYVTVFAAWLAHAYALNGYTDWFLPSKDELNLMYTNLDVVGGLGGFYDAYWSSSENGNGNAWYQDFDDGIQAFVSKDVALSVRAVRAF